MKKLAILTILALSITIFSFFFVTNYYNNYKDFSEIPILNDGRIKPLESFAKSNFSELFNKNSNRYSCYLAEIIFSFDKFAKKKIFYIKNENILTNIEVKKNINDMYALEEILTGIFKNIELINELLKVDYLYLTTEQKELLNLYNKINLILNIKDNLKSINFLKHIDQGNYDTFKNSNLSIQKNSAEYFYLINLDNDKWYTIEDAINIENIKNITNILKTLYNMNKSYDSINLDTWNVLCKEYKNLIMSNLSLSYKIKIYAEIVYNNINFLFYSTVIYFIAFVLSVVLKNYKKHSHILGDLIIFALLFTLFDIFLRLIIAARPPVTNLYESIIFVNMVCSFIFIFILNTLRNEYNMIFITCFLFLLQLIGYNYNYDAEIKNLMSVLNTNFWLILHVLTITTGYSCCLITSVIGHICLYQLLKNNSYNYFQYMNFFILLSLLFSFTGTILGGIWADQSWGRFWGWDPKENGALLVVLWLTLILHFKLVKKDKIYSPIGAICLSIVVSIAWFGVNILNVGLHSYGFTESVAIWLIVFIICEFLYIFILSFIYKNNFLSNI